jgi:hypothetical protein
MRTKIDPHCQGDVARTFADLKCNKNAVRVSGQTIGLEQGQYIDEEMKLV